VWYGYRENEVNIPHYNHDIRGFDVKNVQISIDPMLSRAKIIERVDKSRPVVMASLGCHVEGFPHLIQIQVMVALP